MKLSTIIAAGLAVAVSFTSVLAKDISGAGATFPAPVYLKWADAYQKATGNAVNYQGVGSGAGRKQIEARTVTFAGSDIPQTGKWLGDRNLVQWPMVMGGIVAIVNIEGIGPSDIVLSGQVLGSIYTGAIKRWNDPAIASLNPSAKLPDLPIIVVRRSDGSGTTYNFTYYLSAVNPDFKSKIGTGEAVEWPVGIGAAKNDGVANNVMQTKGSIGYVELAFALQNNLAYTDMINAAGKRVKPTFDSFAAAAANADWEAADNFNLVLANQPGAAAWPMTVGTFILMPTNPDDKEAATSALKFFEWAYANGGAAAKELNYIPMPASVIAKIKATAWKKIEVK